MEDEEGTCAVDWGGEIETGGERVERGGRREGEGRWKWEKGGGGDDARKIFLTSLALVFVAVFAADPLPSSFIRLPHGLPRRPSGGQRRKNLIP